MALEEPSKPASVEPFRVCIRICKHGHHACPVVAPGSSQDMVLKTDMQPGNLVMQGNAKSQEDAAEFLCWALCVGVAPVEVLTLSTPSGIRLCSFCTWYSRVSVSGMDVSR